MVSPPQTSTIEAAYSSDGNSPSINMLTVGTLDPFLATTSLGNWPRAATSGPGAWKALRKSVLAPAELARLKAMVTVWCDLASDLSLM